MMISLTIYNFLLAFFLLVVIIGVTVLVTKLKKSKLNADSLAKDILGLRNQLQKEKESTDTRQTDLCKTVLGLEEALASGNVDAKKRESELQILLKTVAETAANLKKELENETESRKKTLSQKKSSEVRLGHIAEKLAPFLDDFTFDPEDATFLGQPIDYIVFEEEVITFVEIKSGNSKLSPKQRHIRDLIQNNCVAWKEIRIKE
jgi:predicted Holliday junction resolvase-like endonuclease